MVMERNGCEFEPEIPCDIYVGIMGENAAIEAFKLVSRLRQDFGVHAECDLVGRSVKAQMKYANKIGARFSMILGDNELAQKKVVVKNMSSGEGKELEMTDDFVGELADYMAYEQLYTTLDDMEGLDEILKQH